MTAAADSGVDRNAPGVIRQRNRPARFLGDVAISIAATIGLLGALWTLMGGASGAAGSFMIYTGLFLLIPVVIYGTPIAVGIYGLARRRLGFVAGPMVLIAGSFLWSAWLRQIDEAALATIGHSTLVPASQRYQVVAVEGVGTACDHACMRFLAVSPYVLAQRDEHSTAWRTFARGDGDACLADERAADVLDFLARGYRGMCVLRGLSEDIDRALIYREHRVSRDKPLADVPLSFHGWAREVRERSGGTERLLGRRLIGSLGSPLPQVIAAFGVKARQVDVGPRVDRDAFVAAAGGVTVAELEAAGPLSFAAKLDEIERHFGRRAIIDRSRQQSIGALALQTWQQVVASEGRSHPDEVRARVERFLASDEPALVAAGLTSLWSLSVPDRAFAQDALIELALGPMLNARNSSLVVPLKGLLAASGEPFRPDVRATAKVRFLGDSGPTLGQRQLWFIMMARGGATTRNEAVDVLFLLNGPAFEESVRAIGRGEGDVWAGSIPPQWSREEIDRLMARVGDVPTSRLKSYLDAFRFGNFVSGQQKEALVAHVRARLQAAERAPARDAQEIDLLKRLVEIIPANIAS